MALTTALSLIWGPRWLTVTAFAADAILATAVLTVAIARTRAERRLENYQLQRRLLSQPARITDIDPTRIGVELADSKQSILAGGAFPRYHKRGIDAELRGAIEKGLTGTDGWLVVLAGTSKVGKSRTLFEALRMQAGESTLVAPKNGEALRSILVPGQTVRVKGPAVLWLDDLEPFLSDGLTIQSLREWQCGKAGRIVAATFGGKGGKLTATASDLETAAAPVLQSAQLLELRASSAEEVASLRSTVSPAKFDDIERYGLAACLVGAKLLLAKIIAAENSPGGPAGVAVLLTAVNWARCGRTDSLTHSRLRELWPYHLKLWPNQLAAHVVPDEENFRAGLEWALKPVTGPIALLSLDVSYQANDYVIQMVRDETRYGSPPDEVWDEAINSGTCEQATIVGEVAHSNARLGDAAVAFTRGRGSSSSDVGARAGSNLGVVREDQKDFKSALAAYQEVIYTYAEDPDPATRESVATALFRTARLLLGLGRSDEMLTIYRRVIAEYVDDPNPGTRRVVAQALTNAGIMLESLGQLDQARINFERVITNYAEDPDPRTREAVAKALNNAGIMLESVGQADQARINFERVITNYAEDPDPRTRSAVGFALQVVGQSDEALANLEWIVANYADDLDSTIRETVASAILFAGSILADAGKIDEAIANFEWIVANYAEDPDPRTRQTVASAFLFAGKVLADAGKTDQAQTNFKEITTNYASDPYPRTRETVATALRFSGNVLSAAGQVDEALAYFERVVTDYAEDATSKTRTASAIAGVQVGSLLAGQGLLDQALARYDWVVTTYDDDLTPSTRTMVAGAMFNISYICDRLGRSDESIAILQQLTATYAEDPSLGTRQLVAQALWNAALKKRSMGEHDEFLVACTRLIAHYADDSPPETRGVVAMALVHAGIVLTKRRTPSETPCATQPAGVRSSVVDPTLALHRREAVTLFAADTVLGTRTGLIERQVARLADTFDVRTRLLRNLEAAVLSTANIALGSSGCPDAEMTAYQRVISAHSDDTVLLARIARASALVNTAALLNRRAEIERARGLFDQVIAAYADDPHPDIRSVVAMALDGMNEPAAYQQVIDMYSHDRHLATRAIVAKALVAVGTVQESDGQLDLAASNYRRVIDTYASDPDNDSASVNASEFVRLATLRLNDLLGAAGEGLE